MDRPAAIILETVQAEGGVHLASVEWLQGIAALCRELDIVLIVDDIQAGCGRTGTFIVWDLTSTRKRAADVRNAHRCALVEWIAVTGVKARRTPPTAPVLAIKCLCGAFHRLWR